MPLNSLSTEFGFCHPTKQDRTDTSTASSVAKYRLWVANRRVSFQTRSMGVNYGLYGCKNTNVMSLRYLCNSGVSNLAWWYRALSRMITMRLPCVHRRSSNLRNDSNVWASNVLHRLYANLPVSRLTAPKQAIDLRVGAWVSTGSVTSGAILIRARTVLLDVAFVQTPEFNILLSSQIPQFF
jgi:hypothetical protein